MNGAGEPVYVGRDFGGRSLEVDRELVEHYTEAVQDHQEIYDDLAPALLLHSECYRDLSWYLANIYGNLHARQEWEFFRTVDMGSTLTTRGFIRNRYRKRGRDYVVKETWVLDEEGRLVNRGLTHQSFLIAEQSEGTVVDKARESKSGRRFDFKDSGGRVLEPVRKHVTEEMCMAFSGPVENYHTSRQAALALGFPDIVVQGMLPICFVSELMTRDFGQGWLAGGNMDLRLVNVLWGGEKVIAGAQVTGETAEAGRTRVVLNTWVDKEDGTRVIVGTASALA
ncbi:MAG: hypothetical protein ACE5D3_07095, partial [Candidatus Binatia bacterium]